MTFYARIIAYGFLAIVLCVLFLLPILAFAQIPQEAAKWKRDLIRQAHLAWGLDAPIATIAAQIETESAFNPDAVSPAGARGLAQFIPSTAKWIAGAYPALADNEPSNPIWALRAMATYDRYLWERIVFVATECDHAAFMLSAYNGGESARDREIDLCLRALTCDSDRWWGHVEKMRWRAPQFFDENRNYARHILRVREPRYIAAGWGRGLCEEGR